MDHARVLISSLVLMALCGSTPLRSQPLLSVQKAVNVCWTSKSNYLYTIEFSADPSQNDWAQAVPSIRATDTNACVVRPQNSSQQFYQVREFPPPTNMVWIEPGSFTMGSPSTDPDRLGREGPQTLVRLTEGYWIGQYEVTQQEYVDVIRSNPSLFTGDLRRPVEQVSWFDCTNYCYQLSLSQQNAGKLPKDFFY